MIFELLALQVLVIAAALVHLVCEWDLLDVPRWEQADLVQHPCECAGYVCSTRETEQTYLVARRVYEWMDIRERKEKNVRVNVSRGMEDTTSPQVCIKNLYPPGEM